MDWVQIVTGPVIGSLGLLVGVCAAFAAIRTAKTNKSIQEQSYEHQKIQQLTSEVQALREEVAIMKTTLGEQTSRVLEAERLKIFALTRVNMLEEEKSKLLEENMHLRDQIRAHAFDKIVPA